MARRRVKPQAVNHERWLVSYADFITLLFAFFVVMYAISQVNEEKYRVLSDVLDKQFNGHEETIETPERIDLSKPPMPSLVEPSEPAEMASGGDDIAPDGNPADEPAAERFKTMGLEFQQMLKDEMPGEVVSLRGNEEWLEVEVNTGNLFDSGKATLNNRAIQIFGQFAELLKQDDYPVRIEGFTDNQAISGGEFDSNWELSAARAASVVKLFVEEGVKPHRLAALGYGEYQPVASNASAAGRERNRRVVIMISRTGKLRPELPVKVEPEINYEVDGKLPVKEVKLEDGGILFTDDPKRAEEQR